MNKSVYSIVLSDEVVDAVDRLAYVLNTSRSNLINQILAERVSLVTPEKRMGAIIDGINKTVADCAGFQIQVGNSDSMLLIRSALKYRYKPTIRYSLELFRDYEKTIGSLKVSFRTTSAALVNDLESFLRLWAALENKYIVRYFPEGISYLIEDGRFTRTFRLPADKEKQSNAEIGRAIGEYIRMFDEILKIFFSKLNEDGTGALSSAEAENAYKRRLSTGFVLI